MAGRAADDNLHPHVPEAAYIAMLQRIIKELHGCVSEYSGTVHVEEKFLGKLLWEGDVEVFTVIGHPRARICYAWIRKRIRRRRKIKFFAVLGSGVIRSPLDAVKFAHLMTNAQLVQQFSKSEEPQSSQIPPSE